MTADGLITIPSRYGTGSDDLELRHPQAFAVASNFAH
jgi:hypothetical protein